MTLAEIKNTIEANIPNAEAIVLDPMNDGQHLQALVISESFAGMPLIKQHKMVMKPLTDAFAGSVHALGLKTFTPEQWTQRRHQYGL
jgi:acid stress-induced BolA-like protein IbaG/YrbA